MRRNVYMLALLTIGLAAKSQDFKLTFSEFTPSSIFTKVLNTGRIGNTVYEIQANDRKKRNVSMQIYNAADLQKVNVRTIKDNTCEGKPDCIDRHFDYLRTLFLKNNILTFFDTYEKSGDEHLLFAQKINKQGEFEGKFLSVDVIKAKSRSNDGSFVIVPSADSNSFLIVNNPSFDKYQGEKFGFKIYDGALNNLSNFELSLPYKDKNLSLIDFALSNDGKIYMLANIDLEKSDRKRGQAPDYYILYAVDSKDKSIVEYKINLNAKNIEDVAFRISKDNKKISCAGFYSDLKPNEYTGNDIDGFYFLTIDCASQKIENVGFKTIDRTMAAELMGRRKAKDTKGISKTFDIMHMLTRKDGSVSVIAENRWYSVVTTRTCTQSGCTYTTTYHYYRMGIFVINIGKDGSVESLINIPKKQHTTNDEGIMSSFMAFEKDDRLFLIYNDHPENLSPNIRTQKDVKYMPSVNKSILVAVEVNKDGSYTKRELLKNKTKKLISLPEQGFRVHEGEYVLITYSPPPLMCLCLMPFMKAKLGLMKINL